MVLKKLKELFGSSPQEAEYLEIDLNSTEPKKSKILVRPFVLKQFDDVNEILNSLREGYTIAVIDMKSLRAKDVVELKRAISKIKKTVEALEGTIAGFGENTLIVTPSFAEIYKAPALKAPAADKLDTY
ncbi:MAG: cell division protein SepF [Nanoarchaeota archaeon]|nr:cell division protein SepF [Nanoarchaeota archaeon]MBU4087029.1 cell division protein SepF [Nanoarchaeota archaeon]